MLVLTDNEQDKTTVLDSWRMHTSTTSQLSTAVQGGLLAA